MSSTVGRGLTSDGRHRELTGRRMRFEAAVLAPELTEFFLAG